MAKKILTVIWKWYLNCIHIPCPFLPGNTSGSEKYFTMFVNLSHLPHCICHSWNDTKLLLFSLWGQKGFQPSRLFFTPKGCHTREVYLKLVSVPIMLFHLLKLIPFQLCYFPTIPLPGRLLFHAKYPLLRIPMTCLNSWTEKALLAVFSYEYQPFS
jgi:hypothetical protein